MILDIKAKTPAWRTRCDVIDLNTGQDIKEPVWYADDETGEYRVYVVKGRTPSGGRVYAKDPNGPGPLSETRFGRIKIVHRNDRADFQKRWDNGEYAPVAMTVCCPRCGSSELATTTVGYIGSEDRNRVSCQCGWRDRVFGMLGAQDAALQAVGQ